MNGISSMMGLSGMGVMGGGYGMMPGGMMVMNTNGFGMNPTTIMGMCREVMEINMYGGGIMGIGGYGGFMLGGMMGMGRMGGFLGYPNGMMGIRCDHCNYHTIAQYNLMMILVAEVVDC